MAVALRRGVRVFRGTVTDTKVKLGTVGGGMPQAPVIRALMSTGLPK